MTEKIVFEEQKGKRSEVAELRKKLNELDAEKEKWFGEKDKVQKRIVSLIREVKELKNERNIFTSEVKSEKMKRQELNTQINEKISMIKGKGQMRKPINPVKQLKAEIDKMEFAIETQALSFDKEQKLMKQIREKRKQLAEAKKVAEEMKETSLLSREIDNLKKDADLVHKDIRDKANVSQEKHERMIKISAEIDELKKKEEEFQKKFLEYKKQFQEVNKTLKTRLGDLSKINEKISGIKDESAKMKKSKEEKILKNKEEAVEEKIKKKVKLTTEDLLVFQRKAE